MTLPLLGGVSIGRSVLWRSVATTRGPACLEGDALRRLHEREPFLLLRLFVPVPWYRAVTAIVISSAWCVLHSMLQRHLPSDIGGQLRMKVRFCAVPRAAML